MVNISNILRHEIAAASKLDGNFYGDISGSSLTFREYNGLIRSTIKDRNFTNTDFFVKNQEFPTKNVFFQKRPHGELRSSR